MKKIAPKIAVIVVAIIAVSACLYVQSVAAFPVHPIVATTDRATIIREILANLKISWPWYVTRAAGLIAALLLALLALSGIGQITGLTYRFFEPLTAWRLHRALGIAFGCSIAVHVLPLLVDRFVPFNLLQAFVPFTSNYLPLTVAGIHLGTIGVALGIFSMYIAMAIILSSLLWIDKKPFVWRLIHFSSYVLVIMLFMHGLLVGTDLKSGILRFLWFCLGFVIVVGILSRLRRFHYGSRHKDDVL